MPLKKNWSIAAAVSGAVLCIASAAAASAHEPTVAQQMPAAAPEHVRPTPPVLLAQAVVPTYPSRLPATPVLAMQPTLPAPALVAQGGIIRAVSPDGSQPGMLWVVVIGIVCCRLGARVLRMS